MVWKAKKRQSDRHDQRCSCDRGHVVFCEHGSYVGKPADFFVEIWKRISTGGSLPDLYDAGAPSTWAMKAPGAGVKPYLQCCAFISVLSFLFWPIQPIRSLILQAILSGLSSLAYAAYCCAMEKRCSVIRTLSKVSYPLYVLHGLNGFMLMTRLYEAGWNAYLCFIIAVSVTFFLSCLMHCYVEKPLSGWIGRLLFSDAPRLP